jgi:riboflavin synthase
MFTGLIDGQGDVLAIRKSGTECRLRIRPRFAMPHIVNGESIAVNGACLSVENHGSDYFAAYASAETLARTTLGHLRIGDQVNLERAMALGERLGGHLVSGHVDCLARVEHIRSAGQSLQYRLAFPVEYAPHVIAKGSVALDGISLTVNACGPNFLEVNIIPDTQKRTSIRKWKVGSQVNMETDMIGKYVCNMLSVWQTAAAGGPKENRQQKSELSREMLLRNGFF